MRGILLWCLMGIFLPITSPHAHAYNATATPVTLTHDTLSISTQDSIIMQARVITAQELDSHMMNIIEVADATPTTREKITDWIFDHIFIVALIANAIVIVVCRLLFRLFSSFI